MTLEEEAQVLRRMADDPEAFGEIFDAYYPVIIKYLVRRTGDMAVAEDLASVTFIRALSHISSYTPRGTSIVAWLYRIAGNALKDHYRISSHALSNMPDKAFETVMNSAITDEAAELQAALDADLDFQRALSQLYTLREKYQEVLVLHYLEGLKVREIAAATGQREGTVKSLLFRGVRMLREACNQMPARSLYNAGGVQQATPKGEL